MPEHDSTTDRDEADAKAWFYLDHWRDIEEWASLRGDAAQLLDGLLLELGPEVEALADELSAVYVTHEIEGGAYPGFGLRRAEWTTAGLKGVSIVIQWERSRLLKPGSNQWPFVAVLVDGPVKSSSRAALTEALVGARKQFGRNAPTDDWPLWDYVEPDSHEQAVSPEALTARALERYRRLWAAVVPILDGFEPSAR